MRPVIHTPGVHVAVLDRVDIKVSASCGYRMIRMRYKHFSSNVHEACISQHILWAPPESTKSTHPVTTMNVGAFIMSRVFARLPRSAPERKASFWRPYNIEEAVQYLQTYVGSYFKITVECRKSRISHNVFPSLKTAYLIPNDTQKSKTETTKT